jgi:hypothetical protein
MTYLRSTIAALVLSATGCGLISSDVKDFNLALPDKKFSVDTSSWQVDQSKADLFLNLGCAGTPNVCSAGVANACPMNCTGSCDSTTSKCDLSLDVSLYTPVDLVTEKPELKTISSEPVIKVTIDTVTYEVTANTLSVDTPALAVYVAPMSVMSPKDPSAKQIGTIAPITKLSTTSAPLTMTYTTSGKQALIDIMSTFKTPFNVIVGSTLMIKSGDKVPTGKLDAVVHITAHATI